MLSLRQSLAKIGEPKTAPLYIRHSFNRRIPASLRTALLGMTNPQVSQWKVIGKSLWSENTSLSEEAQGIATDGRYWYVCSNHTKSIVKFEGSKRIKEVKWSAGANRPNHFGALDYCEGWLYVALQKPYGIWKVSADLHTQYWLPATEVPSGDPFPWCAIYPVNGRLYTCAFNHPSFLAAYDRNTLQRRSQDDLPLQACSAVNVNHIQGGVFTPFNRLLLSASDPNAIFCFSAFNGYCFGSRTLGDFGSTGSEVEGVTYRPWSLKNQLTPVHVMELDNDFWNKDDFYLWSLSVPDPHHL